MAGRSAHPWFYAAKNAWYFWLDGKKVSLGVKGENNEADALKAWHKLMACDRPTQARADALTVAEVLEAFLADAQARVKPITLEFYKRFLLPFMAKHGSKLASAITPTLAEAWARKPTWSSSTRHDCLGTLATAFRWAERARLVERTPLSGLRLPPKESAGADVTERPNLYHL